MMKKKRIKKLHKALRRIQNECAQHEMCIDCPLRKADPRHPNLIACAFRLYEYPYNWKIREPADIDTDTSLFERGEDDETP